MPWRPSHARADEGCSDGHGSRGRGDERASLTAQAHGGPEADAPHPLAAMPASQAARIDLLFTDIDDTLTLDGRLTADAYSAIEALEAAGIRVVPVTGRPAGWCDMIARFWPVAGVVGENGALYYAHDRVSRRMQRLYAKPLAELDADRRRLEAIRDEVLTAVPRAAVAADQPFRLFDLAIDFAEDVGPLDDAEIRRIGEVFTAHGAVHKVSSIHVNGWFGGFDKRSMCLRVLEEVMATGLEAAKARAAFIGDSPNDATMFGTFPCSIGVANIERFLGELGHRPTWIARARGGHGFRELADLLIAART